jgi:hypothetical protein
MKDLSWVYWYSQILCYKSGTEKMLSLSLSMDSSSTDHQEGWCRSNYLHLYLRGIRFVFFSWRRLSWLKFFVWRRMGEWMNRSTISWPRHKLEVSGQLHAPAALPPGKTPGTHWIGGWVGHRVGLDDVEMRKFLILPGLELRSLARPGSSQSLYRLRYHGSQPYPGNGIKRVSLWLNLLIIH